MNKTEFLEPQPFTLRIDNDEVFQYKAVRWFVGTMNDDMLYLHRDGKIRKSTRKDDSDRNSIISCANDVDETYTGYFESKQAAQDAIELYNNQKTMPRYLSRCSFDPMLPEDIEKQYPMVEDRVYIFFGEIPNMQGHCVVMDSTTGEFYVGYHIEHFKEWDGWD